MGGAKILLIEDDANVLRNLETIVSEEGYKPITAQNGRIGIELAEREKPDLIICDISMPGINGYDVLETLSQNRNTRSIPFIFLTAKVEKEDIRRGMQLGADDYILKPFTIDELLASIKTRLKRISMLRSEAKIKKDKLSKNKYTEDGNIFLRVKDGHALIKVKEIIFISAENQYCTIYCENEKSFLVRRAVSSWEKMLPENKFIRIHRSTIINVDFISKIEKWFNSSFIIHLKEVKESFVVSKRFSARIRKEMI